MTAGTHTTKDVLGRALTPRNRPGAQKGQAPPNKGRKFPGEVFTTEEIDRLLDAAENNGYCPIVGQRNRALIVVLWRCGLRLSEALALMPRDVNLPARVIKILKSKTAAGVRTVGVDDITAEALERWFLARKERGIGDTSPVFCTIIHGAGRRMATTTWQGTIKDIARRAGIDKRVHSHGLRHTFASESIREEISLPVVSRMLGHADTQITHRYLNHTLSPIEAVEAMQRRGAAGPVDLTAELAASVSALRIELTDQLADLVAAQRGTA